MGAMTIAFDASAPETFALYRCVACGAMGAERDCVGDCDFRKLVVVEAEAYADQWIALETAGEAIAAATPVLTRLAALADGESLRAEWSALQAMTRAALRDRPPPAPPPVAPDDERFTLWRCATCAQAEAPQECLGVCVRPIRDYVREEDYLAVADSARSVCARLDAMRALLREIAWTRPRADHWEREATRLSAAAQALRRG